VIVEQVTGKLFLIDCVVKHFAWGMSLLLIKLLVLFSILFHLLEQLTILVYLSWKVMVSLSDNRCDTNKKESRLRSRYYST